MTNDFDLKELNPKKGDLVLLINSLGLNALNTTRPLLVRFTKFISHPCDARKIAVVAAGRKGCYFEAQKAFYLSQSRDLGGDQYLPIFEDVSGREKIIHSPDRGCVGSLNIMNALKNEKGYKAHAHALAMESNVKIS